MDNSKNSYCIVGFGHHAKTKLLPSLKKVNKNIFGIVTSKNYLNLETRIFKTLQDALSESVPGTYFVISSPPKEHFSQIKLILESGRNVYVEKPIFVNLDEAKLINNFLKNKNLFVVEILMYKYTLQYQNFLRIWKKKKNKCKRIDCIFNIPEIPLNTFRDNHDIASSPLYDIGCYVLSLLVDLELSLSNLKISNVSKKNKKYLQFCISGFFRQMEIYLEFGIGKKYRNLVKLSFPEEKAVEFYKFFYGRESKKSIIFKNKNKLKEFLVTDVNGFDSIFKYPHSFWMESQIERFQNIINVNNKLCSLTEELIVSS